MNVNRDVPPNLACPYCHRSLLIIMPWMEQRITDVDRQKLDDHRAECTARHDQGRTV